MTTQRRLHQTLVVPDILENWLQTHMDDQEFGDESQPDILENLLLHELAHAFTAACLLHYASYAEHGQPRAMRSLSSLACLRLVHTSLFQVLTSPWTILLYAWEISHPPFCFPGCSFRLQMRRGSRVHEKR